MTPPPVYYAHARPEVAALIEGKGLTVLELGCARGHLGAALKASGAASAVRGVEIDADCAADARTRLDEVVAGDLETLDLPWPAASFDVITAADVLEHLRDPWAALAKVVPLLRPGGRFILSVPNLKDFRVLVRLILRDEFRYREWGVMDRTHLRFFTGRSAAELLASAGLRVVRVIHRPPPSSKGKLLHALTLGLFPSFFAEQVLVVAERPR